MVAGRLDFAADEDFGQLVRRTPKRVCAPRSVDELVVHVGEARRAHARIAVRGQGHSVFGQSLVEDGWQLDLRALNHIEIMGARAEVQAGCRWADVVRAAAAHDLAPKVLTDYCGLSLGGTLSMGGVGASSFAFGLQTDNVEALTVVTGNGDLIRCSHDVEPELFDNVRAGLGQIGVIASASIRLVPVSTRVVHWRVHHESFSTCLDDMTRLLADGEVEQLSMVGLLDTNSSWSFHLDVVCAADRSWNPGGGSGRAEPTELDRLDYATRLDAGMEAWADAGVWRVPHPWVDVFVPATALRELAHSTLQTLTPRTFGTTGAMILIYPLVTSGATPRMPLKPGELYYLFDVLRCTPGASQSDVEAVLVENRAIYDKALAVGGCMYPIGAVPMTQADWVRHFGDGWPAFHAAKQRFDSEGLLGHGTPSCRG
jgi:FAD/FMN-containing dehydrogenase